MPGEAPWIVTIRRRKGLRPGSETVFADVTLMNGAESARWFVLRAQLHEPLQESFRAELLQVCGFDSNPGVRCLQALGVDTGFLAFQLAAGATLELESLGVRMNGGSGAFELVEAEGLLDSDGRELETLFVASEATPSPPMLIDGQVRVSKAHQRRTLRTSKARGVEVNVGVVARWRGPPLESA